MSEARPISSVFRKMKNPAKPGDLRSTVWRLALYTGKERLDPMWQKRAREYWERQGYLFGLVFGDFTLESEIDPVVGPVIVTFCPVLAVLPGERVEGYRLQ